VASHAHRTDGAHLTHVPRPSAAALKFRPWVPASWAIPARSYSNPAVAIGRTSQSLVVICETGVGRFYYKGVGLENGLSVERRHQSVKPLSHSTTTFQAARWRRIALAIARASMRMSRS
jgi:hypothetical protein